MALINLLFVVVIKGYIIKEFFSNFLLHSSDIKCSLTSRKIEILNNNAEDWEITLVIYWIKNYDWWKIKKNKAIYNNETFCLTYGDGVSDLDINSLIEFHKKNKNIATLTAVQPPARFGALDIDDNNVIRGFQEKPAGSSRMGQWRLFCFRTICIRRY